MAQLGQEFDASNYDPTKDPDLYQAGDYRACITASEIKATKDGHGKYAALTFQFLDPPYKNRKMWVNLNLWHQDVTVKGYAERDMRKIQNATGVTKLKDTNELHNIPILITVQIAKDKLGNVVNKIKTYKPCHAGPQQQQFAASQPATTSTPFAGQQAPWGGPA